MNINLTHLKAFHGVARWNGVGAAARRLGITQPAVSQQIHSLEEESGVELFRKSGRNLVLTEAGKELYEVSLRLFDVAGEAEEVLHSLKGLEKGRLRVAADSPYQVMGLMALFGEHYPGIELELKMGNAREIHQALLEFRADVALSTVREKNPAFEGESWARHRIRVFVGKAHPWSRRSRIALKDLDGAPMIVREEGSATRRAFEEAIQGTGVRPRKVLEIGSREAVREAVALGMGFGVISEAELGPDQRLKLIPIQGFEILSDEHLICLKDRASSRLIRAFFDVARKARSAPRPRRSRR